MAKSICKNCQKEFNYFPSQSKGYYCSNKCQGAHGTRLAVENNTASMRVAKKYFKTITEYKCDCCGIREWNGNPITLQIDHIDGDIKNNVMENLRYLCPNCHTQTDTWGSANIAEENRHKLNTNKRPCSSEEERRTVTAKVGVS